jgi:type II secretory pathway component PulF
MALFAYKGLKSDGTIVEGLCEARVPQDAYRRMEYHGLLPINVSEYHGETDTDGGAVATEIEAEPTPHAVA